MTPGGLGLGRVTQIALAVAVLFGVGLIVAGFVAPLYSTESASSPGEVTRGTATLVEVNGAGVLVVLSLPLVMAVAVGSALWQRRRRGAVALAWTLTGLRELGSRVISAAPDPGGGTLSSRATPSGD